MPAPILITVYDRLTHITQCIESLKNCAESKTSHLIIASDSAAVENHHEKILELRTYLASVSGFEKVTLLSRDRNLGAYNNFIQSLKDVFESYDRVIVLEDDVIVSSSFLKYMNDGLNRYDNHKNIVGVCAFAPPNIANDDGSIYFLKSRTPYGCGMWRDKELDLMKKMNRNFVIRTTRNLRFFKQFESTHPHVARAIPLIANGDMLPYDITSAIIMEHDNLLAVYPPKSISKSIGNDGSGLHTLKNEMLQNQKICSNKVQFDDTICAENRKMAAKFSRHYRKNGIVIVNYLIYVSLWIPGSYYFYKIARKAVKTIRGFMSQ